jgi:CelD/BcsL family acetyltransferase involved in cellulose biosynthesis
MIAMPPTISVETVRDERAFEGLAGEWDALVAIMQRPSPFLCHGWLLEWWRHYGCGAKLQVHVARRERRLVGALPMVVNRHCGVRVASYIGGTSAPLADLLVADADPGAVADALLQSSAAAGNNLLDVFGPPAESRLLQALEPYGVWQIEVVESPVLDLDGGWEETYRQRTNAKKRNLHARRRRQLERLGQLEVSVARSERELKRGLEEAFALHRLRWHGRPDHSDFGTSEGMRFHRDAMHALLDLDAPRIVTLRLDGRPIAFHYYLLLFDRMYVHRLGFDPHYARYSPGLINTLDAIAAAAQEGARRVEFLGGGERYKLELADGVQPMHRLIGQPRGIRGQVLARATSAGVRARLRLKRSPAINSAYYHGLAPARRLRGALRGG